MATQLTLNEIDANSGKITKTYVLSTTRTTPSTTTSRVDQIPVSGTGHPIQHATVLPSRITSIFTSYFTGLVTYVKTLFLPIGYPHSVTPDYTAYQIYDSLQAFASSIAGLLSSRAVLQSLNVVSSSASSSDGIPADSAAAATAATVLSVFQSTLSNLTTILFASHAAPRISADVKYYRFLADVVNDAAFLLDLLAPSLPPSFGALLAPVITMVPGALISQINESLHLQGAAILGPFIPSPRVIVLCASSMLRAVCGVAGGSSKAVLSAHFASNNPDSVGDLNAKDSSQETVIGLLGMWAGGIVVSRVESVNATWIWMLGLLTVHLWTNWRAVKSVRLRALNKERAGLVMERLLNEEQCRPEDIGVGNIGGKESVLRIRHALRRYWLTVCARTSGDWRTWTVGASVEELFASVRARRSKTGSALTGDFASEQMVALATTFKGEYYLLCIGERSERMLIVLKQKAQPIDQLKAWHHAFLLQSLCKSSRNTSENKRHDLISSSLDMAKSQWPKISRALETAGWDLHSTSLDDGRGIRIEIA